MNAPRGIWSGVSLGEQRREPRLASSFCVVDASNNALNLTAQRLAPLGFRGVIAAAAG
jgi:hypothetical protein